jgi:aryl-alcohol dehydrogenase-like predicted oxidoreductase
VHYAEILLMEAIRSYEDGRLEDDVVVGTKAGMSRTNTSAKSWAPRIFQTPQSLQDAIRASHTAMGFGERPIPLWSFHHTDSYPTDDDMVLFRSHCNAVNALVDEGVVGMVGLANASTAHIDMAMSIFGDRLVAVQNEYSPWARAADRPPKPPKAGAVAQVVAKRNKNNVIEWCRRSGLVFTPYQVLGGHGAREGRCSLNHDCPEVVEMARAKIVSPQALVLAWIRHAYPNTLHIVGCRTQLPPGLTHGKGKQFVKLLLLSLTFCPLLQKL